MTSPADAAALSPTYTLSDEQLIAAARVREREPLIGRDRLASLLVGGSYLVTAVLLAVFLESARAPSPAVVALFIAGYAGASRIEFEIGTGAAIPTQLVLVPMLFVLPLSVVPLCVSAGLLLRSPRALFGSRARIERLLIPLVSSWHAVGAVAVLALANAPSQRSPRWSDAGVYVLALVAQFSADYASSSAREWLGLGVKPWSRVSFMAWVWLVDAALAPVGLAVAFQAAGNPAYSLLAVPLLGLLAFFGRERQVRIDHALELSVAYRGTAFLLGDVVEADDEYTGNHSRHVVDLVLEVCDELGLNAAERRDAEFVALLHDVGKIRISAEIINKPGPLDPNERKVIETHTIEGERLLERVGGLLGHVGRIVRSCHERWDGGGYPDGLAGDNIPLVARIVCACDAFSAITTDRPYRRARSIDEALQEMLRSAGTQFDPQVVDALVRVATHEQSPPA
jgi:HD-GYP domain-containing protein (c-di-GMP phosphodiesterase class II)